MDSIRPAFSRRSLIKGMAGAAVLGGVAATGACTTKSSTGSSGAIDKALLPTFTEVGAVKPDLTSKFPGGMHGYFSYPADPQPAVADAPLSGDKITALTYTYDPVAPRLSKNPLWQAVNDRIGGQLDISYALAADYPQRFASTMASGDLPDLVTVLGAVQQLPAMLRAEFVDLTDQLAGDAVSDYPNLAGLPTESWRKAVIDDALWGVPISRPPIGGIVFLRKDLIDAAGLPSQPKDYGEFKELLVGLSDERRGRWACSDPAGTLGLLAASYGIANFWAEEDGKFTANIELDQYRAALSEGTELVKAGVFHPDGVSANNNQRNAWFTSGKAPIVMAGFVGWPKYELWGAEVPGFELGAMLPFPHDADATALHPRGSVSGGLTVIKKSGADQTRKLLKLLDWLATPFGSAEYLLRNFGVEGVSYTADGTDPVLNAAGQNLKLVPFKYVSDASQVVYDPGRRRVSQARFDYQEAAMPMLAPDPTVGLYSETEAAKGAQLTKALDAARMDILQGRKPQSAWKDAVSSWRSGGGDQIREEYQKAAAAGGER
ncbi:MAG TPA: extracellular solute-binding protein [Microlunatus sp.]